MRTARIRTWRGAAVVMAAAVLAAAGGPAHGAEESLEQSEPVLEAAPPIVAEPAPTPTRDPLQEPTEGAGADPDPDLEDPPAGESVEDGLLEANPAEDGEQLEVDELDDELLVDEDAALECAAPVQRDADTRVRGTATVVEAGGSTSTVTDLSWQSGTQADPAASWSTEDSSVTASPCEVLEEVAPSETDIDVVVVSNEGGTPVIDVVTAEDKAEAVAIVEQEQAQPETLAVSVDQPVRIAGQYAQWPASTPYYFRDTPISNDAHRSIQNVSYDLSSGSVFARSAAWRTIEFPWTYGRGDGVTVAVVDTGVDGSHEDLAGQVLDGFDFVRSSGYASYRAGWMADHPHGTHVAGIIAAKDNNTVGITGVAPGVRILPVKVLDATGAGSSSAVAQGIIAAVNAGADIINLSLGAPTPDPALQTAVEYAQQRGVLVVAAGGNLNMPGFLTFDGENYPASYPGVLGVASQETDCGGIGGAHIDIAAHGCAIMSTVPGNGYAQYSGTSMATPQVVGALALLMSMGASTVQAEAAITGNTGRASYFIDLDCSSGTCVDNGGVDWDATRAMFGAGLMLIPEAVAAFRGKSSWDATEYYGYSAPAATPTPSPTPAPTPAPATEAAPSSGGGSSSGGSSSGGGSASSGGGSSSGGSSAGSGGGAGGGAGGGLNEITRISPTTAGAPGSVIALAGWGLEGTRAVYFNDLPAEFRIVNGGHVEVTVPDIPTGVYVIHAQQDPAVGRASYWAGYHVLPAGGATVTPTDGRTPVSINDRPSQPAAPSSQARLAGDRSGVLSLTIGDRDASRVVFYRYKTATKKWVKAKTLKARSRMKAGAIVTWSPVQAGTYRAVITTPEGKNRTDTIQLAQPGQRQ